MNKKIKRLTFAVLIFALMFALTACGDNGGNRENNTGGGGDGEISEPVTAETLVNPNASENAKKLYAFMRGNYKKSVLSGQYINTFEDFKKNPRFWADENDSASVSAFKTDEMAAVNSVTDDYPIILGLDAALIGKDEEDSTGYTVSFAKEWHEAGGIVTMCWHWYAPTYKNVTQSFYSKNTDFNLKAVLADKTGDGYKALVADIERVSLALQPLAEADVPILWRPLHEASGNGKSDGSSAWFWWGASGATAYKQLYNLMYDIMVNEYHLNNLIWVANGQYGKIWYVGDDKCDLISDDPYYLLSAESPSAARTFYEMEPTSNSRYNNVLKSTKTKIVAMSENEFIPDVDKMFENGAYWSMFVTWCREYVCAVDEYGNTMPEYSERYATEAELKAAYSNERVISMNDKPVIYN